MLAEKPENIPLNRAQRNLGTARLTTQLRGAETRLADLYQQGCAKIRLPRTQGSTSLEAVTINTAGGMTGGDQLNWQFTAGQDTDLTITTQACERIYQSSEGEAGISVLLKAEKGSTLCWLPQETILFNRSSARRRIVVELEGDAKALLVEALIFGREAMGETISETDFTDNWHVTKNGELVHVEAAKFDLRAGNNLNEAAVLNGNIAMATVLFLGPSDLPDMERKLGRAQKFTQSGNQYDGVSYWEVGSTGKLLARLAARNGYELRKRLVPLLSLLNDDADLPKSWAI